MNNIFIILILLIHFWGTQVLGSFSDNLSELHLRGQLRQRSSASIEKDNIESKNVYQLLTNHQDNDNDNFNQLNNSLPIISNLTIEECEKYDHLFSKLLNSWDLFKLKHYEEVFSSIHSLAIKDNPQAQYLLGEMYEKGLGDIRKSLQEASKWYTKSVVTSDTQLLKKLARAGLDRVIGNKSSTSNEMLELDEKFSQFMFGIKSDAEYSRKNFKNFLRFLRSHYTYEEIASKTINISTNKPYTATTVSKLVNDNNYGCTSEYEESWILLKKKYPYDFKKFANSLTSGSHKKGSITSQHIQIETNNSSLNFHSGDPSKNITLFFDHGNIDKGFTVYTHDKHEEVSNELNFADCNKNIESIVEHIQNISYSDIITSLDVRNNNIQSVEASRLLDTVIQKLPKLKFINLSFNQIESNKLFDESLKKVLKLSSFKEIDLRFNNLSESWHKEFVANFLTETQEDINYKLKLYDKIDSNGRIN